MSSPNRRLELRCRFKMPVRLRVGAVTHTALSDDISSQGLFVRTDLAMSLRNLIRVEATLPSGGEFSALAMVVFLLPPGDPSGHPPGAGLKLYGMDRATQHQWERFVLETRKQNPSAEWLAVEHVQPIIDPIHRQHPRQALVLKIRPKGVAEVIEMYTTDVSKGGMFFLTEQPLAVGSQLEVEVVHPNTGDVFELTCIVKRQSHEPCGVGVEFIDMDDARRDAFFHFAYVGMPVVVDVETGEDPPAETSNAPH